MQDETGGAVLECSAEMTMLKEMPHGAVQWGISTSDAANANLRRIVPGQGGRSKDCETHVLEHLGMLHAAALRLTRNACDAQDLTQDAVVKALRFHDRFKDGTYLEAWLLTILRNTFLNDYRRRVRRSCLVELIGCEAAVNKNANPEVAFEPDADSSNELLELLEEEVKQAVESLPEGFRQTIIMADIADKSYKEIANAMGCPLGTVMSRLYRGRKLLRHRLHDYAKEHRLLTGRWGMPGHCAALSHESGSA